MTQTGQRRGPVRLGPSSTHEAMLTELLHCHRVPRRSRNSDRRAQGPGAHAGPCPTRWGFHTPIQPTPRQTPDQGRGGGGTAVPPTWPTRRRACRMYAEPTRVRSHVASSGNPFPGPLKLWLSYGQREPTDMCCQAHLPELLGCELRLLRLTDYTSHHGTRRVQPRLVDVSYARRRNRHSTGIALRIQ